MLDGEGRRRRRRTTGGVRTVIWEIVTPALVAIALIVLALLADARPPATDQATEGSSGAWLPPPPNHDAKPDSRRTP